MEESPILRISNLEKIDTNYLQNWRSSWWNIYNNIYKLLLINTQLNIKSAKNQLIVIFLLILINSEGIRTRILLYTKPIRVRATLRGYLGLICNTLVFFA